MQDLMLENIVVQHKGLNVPSLKIEKLFLPAGTQLAVIGPSGGGKTTLINVISGMLRPQEGTVFCGQQDIYALREAKRDQWRGQSIGLVMQDFHLFSGLSALENILLPLRLSFELRPHHHARALMLLERVGLKNPRQKVHKMSRGEMQRVAVARALLRCPALILADEPTASLDAENGAIIGQLLLQLAKEEQATLIVATHDQALRHCLQRSITIEAGRLTADRGNG